MKTRILRLISPAIALIALAFAGCGTPAQNVATANYLAGNAFATYELGQSAANLKGLQDLAAALPLIQSGKVTPFQMGVLNAELHAINTAATDPTQAKNSNTYNQIGALISAGVQANASNNGGNPTANDAIITAALTDFANGIQHGIQFWQGQQSIAAPPATP